MRVILLTSFKNNYSSKRIVEEFTSRGHEIETINPLKCILDVSHKRMAIHFNKKQIKTCHALIPRIGAASNSFGIAIVRQLELWDMFCLNPSDAISKCRDKFQAMQRLVKSGIPIPKTSFANSTRQSKKLIKLVDGPPVVVKILEGSQGEGVFLGHTQQAAESLIDVFGQLKGNFLIQEFIEESLGTDLRCLVLGDRVIAAMTRTAKEGEFRANIHRGGVGSMVELSEEEREVAVRAAKTFGLGFAGVDMLRSKDGPKVIEVNSSPGLEGIEKVTGLNVAGQLAEFVETQVVGEPLG